MNELSIMSLSQGREGGNLLGLEVNFSVSVTQKLTPPTKTILGEMQDTVTVRDFKYLDLCRQTHSAEKQRVRQCTDMLYNKGPLL